METLLRAMGEVVQIATADVREMKDFYKAKGVLLICGDNKDFFDYITQCDALLTDPPYGIGFGKKHTKWSANRNTHLGEWDNVTPEIKTFLKFGKKQIIWGGERFNLPTSRGWLTWVKPDAPHTFSSTEYAWTNQDRPARHFTYPISATNQERVGHPTQKPLALIDWCISFLQDSKTICDPFMGSGTTGVACINNNKKFIGIEKDERYFQIALERIKKAQKQTIINFEKQIYQQTDFLNESA
jgi:site-specific DNA-methyltransferase (adenine-specific)